MLTGDSSAAHCTLSHQESLSVDADVWHSWLPRAHLEQGRALCPHAIHPARAQQQTSAHCTLVKLKWCKAGQGGMEQGWGSTYWQQGEKWAMTPWERIVQKVFPNGSDPKTEHQNWHINMHLCILRWCDCMTICIQDADILITWKKKDFKYKLSRNTPILKK